MSGFLLDTNVVCETTKPEPDVRVLGWLSTQAASATYISAITLGEVRHGALLLDDGRRKRGLLDWIDGTLKPQFSGRILAIDDEVMERWAEVQSDCERRGGRIPFADSLIAATALSHGLTMVTRNTGDFIRANVPVLNPWTES